MNLKDLNKFDSDRLDGKHASNSANNVPVLDSNAKIPLDQIPTGTTKTTVALGKHIHDDMYYTESEIESLFGDSYNTLKGFPNIIIKCGRFVPNTPSHIDPVLGVRLMGDNQYAKRIS